MKQFSLFFFLMILLASCGGNTNQQKPTSNDLAQLENDWMHATMKRDQALLNEIVAPEFTLSGMQYIDSPAVTRTMWMYNTMNNLKIDSVHFIKTKVSTIQDVGIVKAEFYWSGSYDERPFADSTAFVDTWVKRNGAWMVISRVMTD